MLVAAMRTRAAASTHPHDCRPADPAARRAPAPAARRSRADADRSRGRPVLEGVHLADRARQDAPDDARRSSGSRCASASTPASSRAASRPTSARRRRRSSPAPTRSRRSTSSTEAIAEYTRALPAVLGTGAAELRVRALNGEAMAHAQARRREVGARAARRVARSRRGRDVHRRRPRRCSLSPRRLPLQAFEHLDRGRVVRRGAVARRALGAAVRRAEAERLRVALAVLPPSARLRSCARGRRARARARGGAA